MEMDLFGVRWVQNADKSIRAEGLAAGVHQPDGKSSSTPKGYAPRQPSYKDTFQIDQKSDSSGIATFIASFLFDTANSSGGGCCLFHLRFPVEKSTAGIWLPRNMPTESGFDETPNWWVVPTGSDHPDSLGNVHLGGGFHIASKTTQKSLKIEANKLYFCPANNEGPALADGPCLPLRVEGSATAGCTLDLAKGVLVVQNGFLQLATGYYSPLSNGQLVTKYRDGTDFAVMNSVETVVPLRELSANQPRRLSFFPSDGSNGPIPLHARRLKLNSPGGLSEAASRLAMGLQARDAGLTLTFLDGERLEPKLTRLALLNKPNATFTLSAAAFRDMSNSVAPIYINEEILLAVVPLPSQPSAEDVASLILDVDLNGAQSVSADCAAETIFGSVPGHSFNLGRPGNRQLGVRVFPGSRATPPTRQPKPPYPALREGSVPYLIAESKAANLSDKVKIITPRPGTSWAAVTNAGRVEGSTARFEFGGDAIAVPIIPEGLWGLKSPTPFKLLLDSYLKGLKSAEAEAWHESGMVQRAVSEKVAPERLFAPRSPGPATVQAAPLLIPKPRAVAFDLGPISVSGSVGGWSNGPERTEYIVIKNSAMLKSQSGIASLALDQSAKFIALNLDQEDLLNKIEGWPCANADPLRAILKFGRGLTLRNILDAEHVAGDGLSADKLRADYPPITDDANPAADRRPREEIFKDLVDPQVLDSPTWVGLVVFKPQLANKCNAFSAFLPDDRFKAAYVAIGPSSRGSTAELNSEAKPIVWARLRYVEPRQGAPIADPTPISEAVHHVNYLDLAIASGEVSSFLFKSTLQLTSFFGTKLDSKPIFIRGRLQRTDDGAEIGFASDFTTPIPVFSAEIPGPIKQVFIQRIAIASATSSVRILIDGRLEIGDFSLGSVGNLKKDIPSLDFRHLSIALPSLGKLPKIPRLAIDYPSIHLDVNVPVLSIFGGKLRVSLAGLAVDMPSISLPDQVKLPALSWDVNMKAFKMPTIPKWFATDLQFSFAGLPELADSSLSNLAFRFRLGFPFGGAWENFTDNVRLSLSALSFEPLRLNLARVLSICADRCIATGSGFHLDNASITILNKPILGGLSVSLTQQSTDDANRTFLAAWLPLGASCGSATANVPASEQPCEACGALVSGDLGFMKFDWFIAGQGLYLSDALAKDLVTIPNPDIDIQKANEEIAKAIGTSPAGSNLTTPVAGVVPSQEWLFAMGFSVGSNGNKPLFSGRALFLDRRFYGLSLRGRVFEELFDSPAAITGLYTRRQPRSRDSFYLSFTVPRMTFSTFQFTGGEISIEWFANGDFMFDAGFPHLLPTGGRDWRRSLGVIVTPYQGSGGVYIGMRHGLTTNYIAKKPGETSNEDKVQFDYGFAIQAGLGAAFKAGPVVAWVTVGVYAILEGTLVVTRDFRLEGINIVGALGVLVRGGAQLDWWIISVRLEVVASAEIRGQISWGSDADGKPLQKSCGSAKEITMNMAFELFCALSAEACIGSSPFRICKGITIGLRMPIEHCFVLGSA